MTTNDLITASLRRIGVVAEGETPSADSAADALLRLNDLIDSWATQGLTMYTVTRTTWALTTASSYTVGAGATVNIPRPTNASVIQHIGYIDNAVTTPIEYLFPGGCLTEDAYAAIVQKTLTSTVPSQWYYNPTEGTSGYGTLKPWPVPSNSNLLGVIYAPAQIAELAINDTLHLPPGYRRALRDNLAAECAAEWGIDPQTIALVLQSAAESKADIKRANIRIVDLPVDPALTARGRWWDITVGP